MRTAPLFVCPCCEPGPYMYAGTIVEKLCSACARGIRSARTGSDRKYGDSISPDVRRIFEGGR